MSTTVARETLGFQTEVRQLLHLMIHSLYSNHEIFLRELISNAADAIDKIRFDALTNPELLEGDSNWKIKITPDKQAGTLTVSDNGVGMSQQTIVENLGQPLSFPLLCQRQLGCKIAQLFRLQRPLKQSRRLP